MEAVSVEYVIRAVVTISLLLVIISIPTLLIVMKSASSDLKRYVKLRSLRDVSIEDIPERYFDEWAAITNNINYASMISDRLEKLHGLRPAMFQAEIAIALMVIMFFYPGYSNNVMILMIALILISAITLIYSFVCIRRYAMEYVYLLHEMTNASETSHDPMFI